MPTKSKAGDKELFESLCFSLDEDLLTDAYTPEEIDEELKSLGLNPKAIGERGKALADELLNKQRLSWQDEARIQQERMRRIISVPVISTNLTKDELLRQIKSVQQDPRITAYFRKRTPEEASEEELRELLREVELLNQLTLGKSGGHRDS